MKGTINSALTQFQSLFAQKIISEAEKIVGDLSSRMQESGFSLNLTIPNASLLSLQFSGAEMLQDLIETKTENRTSRRRKDSVVGKICGWFGTDKWGWESYSYTQTSYEINLTQIRESALQDIGKIFDGLEQDMTKRIRLPLQEGIGGFFTGLRKTVEQIRGDLLQSIRDQEHSKEEKEALTKRLRSLKKRIPGMQQDSGELHQDTRHQFSASQKHSV